MATAIRWTPDLLPDPPGYEMEPIQPDFRCPFCGAIVESQDAPCGEECESKAAAEFYADQAYEQQCEDADRLASIEEVNGGGK
jgi:hypothetical protein